MNVGPNDPTYAKIPFLAALEAISFSAIPPFLNSRFKALDTSAKEWFNGVLPRETYIMRQCVFGEAR